MPARNHVALLVETGATLREAAQCFGMTKGQVGGHWYRYRVYGPQTPPKPVRHCRECDAVITDENVSGLCQVHKVAQRERRDATIAAKYGAGASVDDLASEYAISRGHIYHILADQGCKITRCKSRYLLSDIIELTADVFGVTTDEIRAKTRTRQMVDPRHCIALVARALSGRSYPQIGAALNRDHSTIINGENVARWRFEKDAVFRNRVLAVVVRLEPVSPYRRPPITQTKPLIEPEPILIEPEPEEEPADLDDMSALSLAVQRHYAAGRDCIEVY